MRYEKQAMKINHPLTFCFSISCLTILIMAGCGQKQPPQAVIIQNKVVAPEPVMVSGQMFIVTKGHDNVFLGDEKVALITTNQLADFIVQGVTDWSNQLNTASSNCEDALTHYSALDKTELDKYQAAMDYHQKRMDAAPSGSAEWEDAFNWWKKNATEKNALNETKRESLERTQLELDIDDVSNTFNIINFPSADDFYVHVATTTTDSQGRFEFMVNADATNLMLVTQSSRSVAGSSEHYWWLVPVLLEGKTTEKILSNDNVNENGIAEYCNPAMKTYLDTYRAYADSWQSELNSIEEMEKAQAASAAALESN
jgi:hypothetical protein